MIKNLVPTLLRRHEAVHSTLVSEMKRIIENTPIKKLIFYSLGSGFGIIFVSGMIGNMIFGENPPEFYLAIQLIILSAVFSVAGFASIIKRETIGGPGGKLTGSFAVFSGWFWVAFCSVVFLVDFIS